MEGRAKERKTGREGKGNRKRGERGKLGDSALVVGG